MDIDLLEDEIIIDYDEVEIGLDKKDSSAQELPKIYLLVERLIMKNQVRGFVEEGYISDLIVPVYSPKNDELKLVGVIELTSENVLNMKQLGLELTLIRGNKEPIKFDKASDYVQTIKTLKKEDTYDISYPDIPNDSDESEEGQVLD